MKRDEVEKPTVYIKNRYLSVIFKLVIVLCGLTGLQMQLQLFSGNANWEMFRFFTNLSNLACVLYFLGASIWILTGKCHGSTTFLPALKGIVMMSITVTMLVARFMLGGFTMNGTMGSALILLHYIVPIMTISDWLFFDEKGLITKVSPVIWVAAPLVYLAYAILCTQIMKGLGYAIDYPYPFIDVDTLGVATVSLTIVALVVAFIALGYVYYGIDWFLSKVAQKEAAV